MSAPPAADPIEQTLRRALETRGHRYTEQRAAVFRFISSTTSHPTAEDVFLHVRETVKGISLATVYKSLETLVGCGLLTKLSYADGSARYDGRTDPHFHVRCVSCGRVSDIPGHLGEHDLEALKTRAAGFTIIGYQLELSGYCASCAPAGLPAREA